MDNRKSVFVSATLLLLLSFVFLIPTAAATDAVVAQEVETQTQTSEEPVEVLVTLEEPKHATTRTARKSYVENSQNALLDHAESTDGVRVLGTFWITNAVLVEVEPGYDHNRLTRIAEVQALKPNTEIEVLETASSAPSSSIPMNALTDGVAAPTSSITTASTETTYGMEQINAPDVWSTHGTKGGGVNVAVLDTGVNASHPDIDLRTTDSSDPTYPGGWAEFDTSGNRVTGSTPYDSNGHGTHVSGTVAGDHTGVAPEANLMHGLIINGNSGTLAQALSGIEWAIENDADVISMSIGGGTDGVWADVARNANDMNVVLVSSVGNDGAGTSASPGNVYDVVSVGAVDESLDVAGFSGGEVIDTDATWGDSALDHWHSEYVVPDVVSAGVNVNSTSASGGYGLLSGTSMAAPHVAGATALGLSASGSHKPEEVREAFSLTAFGSGSEEPGTRYGHGAADALAVTDHLLDDASVSGTVVNGSGATVEDAEVLVEGVRVDNTDGGYEAGLTGGTWTIEASAPGYEDTEETLTLSQDETRGKDIVLKENNPAFFDVGSLDGPSSAGTEETVAVSATVSNTGDVSGTQDVELRLAEDGKPFDGSTVEDTKSISLGGGDSQNVGFTVTTPSKGGDYAYGVFTEDDSATGKVTIEEVNPAFFDVGSLSGPSSAETGETVTVSAVVGNTGEDSGTQDVTLRLAEEGDSLDGRAVRSTKEISLVSGGSENVDFTVDAPGVEGSYGYGVFTDDTSVTDTLVAESKDPAFFEVISLDGPSLVKKEGDVKISATVRNTGEESATKEVALRLAEEGEALDGDTEAETRSLSLDGKETKTVEFTTEAPGVEGSYVYGAFTGDGSATDGMTVDYPEPAFFDVRGLSFDEPILAGEPFSVNATVKNTGEVEGTQEVELLLDGEREAGRSRTLTGEENMTVEFEGILVADAGTLNITVSTENDDANPTASVLRPAFFDIEGLTPVETTVEVGSEVTVAANVTNRGGVGAAEEVEMVLNGKEVDNETVLLEPEETKRVGSGVTAPTQIGRHIYGVRTADTEKTGTLTVERRLLDSPTPDVSDELWTAVTSQDKKEGNLSLSDLGDVITTYRENPADAEVDGAKIRLADLGNLIRYYRNEVR